jgi:hypothetical protein
MSEPKRQELALTPPPNGNEPPPMIAMMERLALNPELPVDKLRELLNMQLQIRAIEAEQEYSAAMARVQEAMPVVLKDAFNEQTKSPYATVSAIASAIKPIYTREGFSISFTEGVTAKEDHVRICATVRHRAGHKDDRPFVDVAVDKAGIKGNDNKTMTHAEGSSFTYGRRYLTCMIFDVATGLDADGNGGGGAQVISEDEALRLEERIKEVGTPRAVFMRWLGVEALDQVRAKDLQRALGQLDKLAANKPRR